MTFLHRIEIMASLYLGYDFFTHNHADALPLTDIQIGSRISLKPKDAKYSGGWVVQSRIQEDGREFAKVVSFNGREKTVELIPYYCRHVYRRDTHPVESDNGRSRDGGDHHQGRVLVVGETVDFRLCARLQVLPTDFCVEIGSSYGEASAMLARYCRKTVGFDCSKECVEEARKRYPALTFIVADCFLNGDLVKKHSAGSNVVFVDIGGDRRIPDQLHMLDFVLSELQPALVILKSRKLYRSMLEHGAMAGIVPGSRPLPDMAQWIPRHRLSTTEEEL